MPPLRRESLGQLRQIFPGAGRGGEGAHRQLHQLQGTVIRCHPVRMKSAASATAMDDSPLAATAHPNTHRVHHAFAVRGAVAGQIIQMHAGQTVRAVVAVLSATFLGQNGLAAYAAGKGSLAAVLPPVGMSSVWSFQRDLLLKVILITNGRNAEISSRKPPGSRQSPICDDNAKGKLLFFYLDLVRFHFNMGRRLWQGERRRPSLDNRPQTEYHQGRLKCCEQEGIAQGRFKSEPGWWEPAGRADAVAWEQGRGMFSSRLRTARVMGVEWLRQL